jgi:hypothetical protein
MSEPQTESVPSQKSAAVASEGAKKRERADDPESAVTRERADGSESAGMSERARIWVSCRLLTPAPYPR